MVISRKSLQMIIAVMVCINVPCFGLELHKAKTELEFETGSEKQQWLIGSNKFGRGPLKPLHAADIFIRNLPTEQNQPKPEPQYPPVSVNNYTSFEIMKKLLETSAGQSMSQQQKDLVTTGNVICPIGKHGDMVGNHTHFRLYAVTKNDAEKIAEAFLDYLISKTNKNLEPLLTKQQEHQKEIVDKKNSIVETETKLKTAEAGLNELKKTVHYLTTDEAKNAISKMNTKIDDLDIKLAAMRIKLQTTEQTLQEQKMKKTTQSGRLRIEEEVTELTGKLEAAISENKTAAIARNRTISKLKDAQSKLNNLKKTVYDLSERETKDALLVLYKTVDDFSAIFTVLLSELQAADLDWKEETKETGIDSELKLEQILKDQKTELEAAQASKETATILRKQAEEFYHLAQQVSQFQDSTKSLASELLTSENALTQVEEKLTNPEPKLLPPEVYQNKVTIYPVQSGFSFGNMQ